MNKIDLIIDALECHSGFYDVPKLKLALAAARELKALQPVSKRLIGWRTEDFLMETNDISKAQNWECVHRILPIFEGDPNTKLKEQL